MRKARLYQLLAVASGLGVAVASTPTLAKPAADVVVPLNWTAGTATVDGDISEWDLSGGNIMCTAGSIDESGNCSGNGKEHLSTVYLRYDCDTSTMYVLVLGDGADRSEGDAWVTVGGNSNKVLENFAWVGNTDGYEASFTMTEDSDNVQVHLNVDGDTSSTGKNGYTRSITGLDSCEMPVVEDPTDDPADDPVEDPTDDPVEDPVDDPVEDPADNGGGNPNMACSEIMGSNGAPMSLIAKYETNGDGDYNFAEGTDIINIEGGFSGGTFSVDSGVVEVAAVIVKGGTVALPDEDGDDSFSNEGLVNNGGQTADISNVQFCQEGVFDSAGAEVCLWSANKDADGNYINIEQVGCVGAEKGKFYAIEAAGEFSNALEAE